MKQKEILTRILFNILKILGAGWLGALFSYFVVNVCKFFINGNLTIEYILWAFVSTAFAVIALGVMSYQEWYKERVPVSMRTVLLCSIATSLIHMLLCIVSFGSVYILMLPRFFTVLLANMEVDSVNIGHVFITTLIFNPIYALSLFFGGIKGQKKRVKDRSTLCENQTDSDHQTNDNK